jgi:hypothetical protein
VRACRVLTTLSLFISYTTHTLVAVWVEFLISTSSARSSSQQMPTKQLEHFFFINHDISFQFRVKSYAYVIHTRLRYLKPPDPQLSGRHSHTQNPRIQSTQSFGYFNSFIGWMRVEKPYQTQNPLVIGVLIWTQDRRFLI